MPESTKDRDRSRQLLWELLLGYLQSARVSLWPGADGLTLDDALSLYQHAAAGGQVPQIAELQQRHPELAALLAALERSPGYYCNTLRGEILENGGFGERDANRL